MKQSIFLIRKTTYLVVVKLHNEQNTILKGFGRGRILKEEETEDIIRGSKTSRRGFRF